MDFGPDFITYGPSFEYKNIKPPIPLASVSKIKEIVTTCYAISAYSSGQGTWRNLENPGESWRIISSMTTNENGSLIEQYKIDKIDFTNVDNNWFID